MVARIRKIRKIFEVNKLIRYSPKQDDHKQQILKHRNKQKGSKTTNHKLQTMTFRKQVFVKGSAKMIDGTEKPKIPSKFAKDAARQNEFDSNKLELENRTFP